jgi:hypothetical protein
MPSCLLVAPGSRVAPSPCRGDPEGGLVDSVGRGSGLGLENGFSPKLKPDPQGWHYTTPVAERGLVEPVPRGELTLIWSVSP